MIDLPQTDSVIPTGGDLPELRTRVPGPKSVSMLDRLRAVECPDVTWVEGDFPVVWSSAKGANITDVDGNRYVDLNAGFGVASIGHAHPKVVEAVRKQSERLMHGMGDVHPNELRVRLAEALRDFNPIGPDVRVMLSASGSEAVESALKTAALATGKPGVIAFEGGYHGVTLGALPVTGWPKFQEGFEGRMGRATAIEPWPVETTESLRRIERIVESGIEQDKGRLKVGAILIEPIQGRGGIQIPPEGFLRGLRDLCDRTGVLLIFDEVYTGFGRTGRPFGADHEGVTPDLVAVGKALGGGMPVSACIGKSDLIEAWGNQEGEARHTHTFMGHPVACAAALATLGVIRGEEMIERSATCGKRLIEGLKTALGSSSGRIRDIRGAGMMIGIEITDPATGQADPEFAWSVIVRGLSSGLVMLTSGLAGNVISITPPFILEDLQADYAVEEIAKLIQT